MISRSELQRAAEVIRAGQLVAFPTETVYGLGANALDPDAVARIYEAKGRPATSPLIVHVGSIGQARELAADWPAHAQILAEKFWPGPLTLVLKKRSLIPDIVTAGLDTVGLRVPANEIALSLIRESGCPIAAPSANRFTELSPTRAEHVRASLGDRVRIILDDGPTAVGIESTVLALYDGRAALLRPGVITREDIEALIGPIMIGPIAITNEQPAGSYRSPGQHLRHYQPNTPLFIGESNRLPTGNGAFLHRTSPSEASVNRAMPADARHYAELLYSVLHDMDRLGLDWIAVEPLPETSDWHGVRDRLERAARR